MKRLIDAKSLAEMLSLSIHSIRRFTSMGLLPCVHITPRSVRYDLDEVNRFIEERSYKMNDVKEMIKKERRYPYLFRGKVSPPIFYIFVKNGIVGFLKKSKYPVLSVMKNEKEFVLITYDEEKKIREIPFKDSEFASYRKEDK